MKKWKDDAASLTGAEHERRERLTQAWSTTAGPGDAGQWMKAHPPTRLITEPSLTTTTTRGLSEPGNCTEQTFPQELHTRGTRKAV